MLIPASLHKVIIGMETLMFKEAIEVKCRSNFRPQQMVKAVLFTIRNAFQDIVVPFALHAG
jgi:hypothetical protein